MTTPFQIPKKWRDIPPLQTENVAFGPVIQLPADYEVYDFSEGYDPDRVLQSPYWIGRYAEHRPQMYISEHFERDTRDIHVGIDIAAPVGEPVLAFHGGTIFKLGDNPLPLDYGPTLITRHRWHSQTIFALHGHLSRSSLEPWNVGDSFELGAVLGAVGHREENGGWNPHLHFQLSLVEPATHDLPGVVNRRDLTAARRVFPDPRLVLGPLYEDRSDSLTTDPESP